MDMPYWRTASYKVTMFCLEMIFLFYHLSKAVLLRNIHKLRRLPFVRLVLVLSAVDILSNTLINLQIATGKIRNYQLAVGGMLMMNFPLSYLCLKFGFSPVSVYIVAIVVAVCCLVLRLLFLRRMVEKFSMTAFLRNVSANVIKVAFAASILPLSVFLLMDDGWFRFLLLVPLGMICAVCSVYWVGCSASERSFISGKLALICKKIGL